MSELQDLYESINPIPENLSRCGDGYCQHVYMLIDPYASGYKARFEGFKHGLQHQQSKVDELQKQRDSFIKAYEIEMDESIELQKRLDAAFKVLSQLNDLDDEAHKRWKREACMFSQGESNAYEHAVRLLEQALKGDQ